jgi:hypothetical protein
MYVNFKSYLKKEMLLSIIQTTIIQSDFTLMLSEGDYTSGDMVWH